MHLGLSPSKSDLWTLGLLEKIAGKGMAAESGPWNQITRKVNSLESLFDDTARG